ncbi:SDR family NAD(P)-dependent oxidoreductase [Streptomyces triculaminicus]|uniref:SDR family NAD(P)-dependent oxidoreductase n=1 Tax=Streptomyces triculaminicus TaxID=2816232 RepID=UPI0033C64993
MRTMVIQGGTDGMGRALALAYLRRGERVVILGRDVKKGKALLDSAREMGADDRASFVKADLALVAENRRVIEHIRENFPVVDALVLCARHYSSVRRQTSEGFERTFALFYLSRFLLSHGLTGELEKAERPVVMNVAGPGTPMGRVHWDDFGLARGYDGVEALNQGGKANDLLGVSFAERHATGRIRYVLINPGSVSTSFSGDYDAETAAHIEMMKKFGKPVEQGIVPIAALIDAPPAARLSAYAESRPIGLGHPSFDPADAARLHEATETMLAR